MTHEPSSLRADFSACTDRCPHRRSRNARSALPPALSCAQRAARAAVMLQRCAPEAGEQTFPWLLPLCSVGGRASCPPLFQPPAQFDHPLPEGRLLLAARGALGVQASVCFSHEQSLFRCDVFSPLLLTLPLQPFAPSTPIPRVPLSPSSPSFGNTLYAHPAIAAAANKHRWTPLVSLSEVSTRPLAPLGRIAARKEFKRERLSRSTGPS